jgi:hypothetical protein
LLAAAFASVAYTQEDVRLSHQINAPRVRLLVPAYFYPAGAGLKEWDRLFAAAGKVPIVVIVNPASGPGKEVDANYVKILERAKKVKKITLIGYVDTSYAKRPLAEVKVDVDQWLKFYRGIEGIFFDQQASGAEQVGYQSALYEYVRKKRGLALVITNPGTVCAEAYLAKPATDAACLFEGAKAFEPAAFPAWVTKYEPQHVAALSYGVAGAPAMRQCITAAAKKVGYCYVTDSGGANPWDRLPKYWDEEVAAVATVNQHDHK